MCKTTAKVCPTIHSTIGRVETNRCNNKFLIYFPQIHKCIFSVIQISLLSEVVVHANPQNIPYSLLAIRNIWQNRLYLEIECHSHSTVAKLPKQAIAFQDVVHAGNTNNSNLPKLKVTLIWNDSKLTLFYCH